jgi:hypothetical protein
MDEVKRNRTICGSIRAAEVSRILIWALERGYLVHIKDYSGSRAAQLAKSVQVWFDDLPSPTGSLVG